MKTKTWLLIVVLAVGVMGVIATRAFAMETNSAAGYSDARIFKRLASKLDLTSEQQAQVKQVLLTEKGDLRSLLSRLHAARIALRETIQAKEASEDSVRAASAKVAAVEADLAVERLKIYGKIAPRLTQDQRDKLADLEQHMDELVNHVIDRMGELPAS